MRGRVFTPATRAKLSVASRSRKAGRRLSRAEELLVLWLNYLGVPYRRQMQPLSSSGSRHAVDFLTGDVVVEVDGPSHLMTAEKDAALDARFRAAGYRVFRVANSDILPELDGNPLGVARAIRYAARQEAVAACPLIRSPARRTTRPVFFGAPR